MALEEKGQPRCLDRVEGVARLVQETSQVVVDADGVQEDQRKLAKVECRAVPARRLAFAIFEVKQIRVDHGLVIAAEVGIDVPEHVGGASNEGVDVVKWLECRPSLWVDRSIPRA